MKKLIVSIGIVLGLTNLVQAQQPISYNLYPQNSFLLNPAAMTENNCFNAFVNRQSKWADLSGGPVASTFGLNGKIGSNSYLGGMVVGDKRSLVSYFTANLMYAHLVKFDANSSLALGLSLGVANNSLNQDMVNTKDLNDPAYTIYNSTRLDAGFGAIYNYKQLKAGLSIPHIFDQFGDFSSQYNVNLAYDFYLKNKDWKVTPMAMRRNYKEVGGLYDIMGLATWKEMVSGQLGYRTDKSVIAGIGFNWKMLRIAYAYQYHVGSTYNSFSSAGTNEIQLAVRLCRSEPKKAPEPVADVNADKVTTTVLMTDEKYGTPVAGNIVITKEKATVYEGKGDPSGKSTFHLKPGKYTMLVTAKGYLPQQETVDLSNEAKGSNYEIKLKPIKIEKGLVFKFSSVNFETGSDRLKTSSYEILDKMADILNDNPQMVIEVAGYTDNVGDDNNNKILSEKRAKSVAAYLKAKNVKESQMKTVGYGEANPIASNETEAGRLQNRRVMFTVLEY
jgi:type IX secretion system PorP/SprF family membrane protein